MRARKEEYEALAGVINQLPSKKESRAAIDRLGGRLLPLSKRRKAKLDAMYNEKSRLRVAGVLQLLRAISNREASWRRSASEQLGGARAEGGGRRPSRRRLMTTRPDGDGGRGEIKGVRVQLVET